MAGYARACAGGRYDKLVGMFSGKDVPAVGVSIGIERVFSIMEAQARERAAAAGKGIRATETAVLVASIGNGLQPKRMEIAAALWAAGIPAEFGYKVGACGWPCGFGCGKWTGSEAMCGPGWPLDVAYGAACPTCLLPYCWATAVSVCMPSAGPRCRSVRALIYVGRQA